MGAKSDGRRDLALIRASGSTARVLNLALVYERFGAEPDYGDQPLFKNAKLNRALIVKHAIRRHERELFERPEPNTTKIIFPYSATELGLGGTSVMVGERKFEGLLRAAIGNNADEAAFAADLELINALHEMPSFDPFLMREQLRARGLEAARCYFEISEADIANMIDFVAQEIEPLTRMAFGAGGRRAAQMSQRLAEKLMTDENASALDPLRETLRLSAGEYARGVFAWKGFLYYTWAMRRIEARQEAFKPSFIGCTIARSDANKFREAEQLKRSVARGVEVAARRCREVVDGYVDAFSALTRGRANVFRDFLLDAPATYGPLGEATGALMHIHSFWGFRFKDKAAAPYLEADEALEIYTEFDTMLDGVELCTDIARAPEDLLLT
jgi:hypothetical protein